jgi:hypothetical protein
MGLALLGRVEDCWATVGIWIGLLGVDPAFCLSPVRVYELLPYRFNRGSLLGVVLAEVVCCVLLAVSSRAFLSSFRAWGSLSRDERIVLALGPIKTMISWIFFIFIYICTKNIAFNIISGIVLYKRFIAIFYINNFVYLYIS